LARPKPIDLVYFLQGFGVDGVFAVSITLIFARHAPLSEAVLSGSALLAMRHFGEAIAAPLFGWIADRVGARKVFVAAAFLTTSGFILVAIGATVSGALIMLIFRGALASLGPAVITQGLAVDDDAIGPLARMQAWRDFGAALGPLATGFLLTIVTAELLHAGVAAVLLLALAYWLATADR
jgi:MFS family permease